MKTEITLRIEDGQFQLIMKNSPKQFPKSMRLVNIRIANSKGNLNVEAVLIEGKKIGRFLSPSNSLHVMCMSSQRKSKIFSDHLSIFVSLGYPRHGMFYITREEFAKLVLWFLPR